MNLKCQQNFALEIVDDVKSNQISTAVGGVLLRENQPRNGHFAAHTVSGLSRESYDMLQNKSLEVQMECI